MTTPADAVADALRAEIRARGPIPFSRFMELALYLPGLGYYERQRPIGRRGDFYTSVSVGSLFGRLLANKFASWLDETPQTQPRLAEAGAHQGDLAADILEWFQTERPGLFERLQYTLIEPSPERRDWQAARLKKFEGKIRWLETLPAPGTIDGVLFSNELLDAMPADRLRWDAANRRWEEWRVDEAGDRFVWVVAPLRPSLEPLVPVVPAELAEVLPGGYTLEISAAALEWWRDAARALRSGRLLAFDYGYDEDGRFAPGRQNGTVRAYRRHQVSGDVLAQPGESDITAHVDFGALREAGERAGLATECFQSQGKFLTDIARQSAMDRWTPSEIRQFQTLIHPEHLGRAFSALGQRR